MGVCPLWIHSVGFSHCQLDYPVSMWYSITHESQHWSFQHQSQQSLWPTVSMSLSLLNTLSIIQRWSFSFACPGVQSTHFVVHICHSHCYCMFPWSGTASTRWVWLYITVLRYSNTFWFACRLSQILCSPLQVVCTHPTCQFQTGLEPCWFTHGSAHNHTR